MDVAIGRTVSFEIGPDNELDRFLGIIGLHVIVEGELHTGDLLQVDIEDLPKVPPLRFADLPAAGRFPLNLHASLLPPGGHLVRARLMDADGRNLCERSFAVTVAQPNTLAVGVAARLREAAVDWAFLGQCDSGRYPYSDLALSNPLRPWFDRPDAEDHIKALHRQGTITPREAEQLQGFLRNGIILIEKAIDPALIDEANAEIDEAVAQHWQGYSYGSSQRIEHLHGKYPNIARLWLHPGHRRWTDLLFGVKSRPCQTLTYLFGSQQHEHQDTIHLTTFPPGYMCGAWIALQDIEPDSGELIYYPQSHRERRIYISDLGVPKTIAPEHWPAFEAKALPAWREIGSRYERVIHRPKKGDIAIWHENLLHGGSVRNNEALERRSIVVHSYADGALAFADSSGITCTAVPVGALTPTESATNQSSFGARLRRFLGREG